MKRNSCFKITQRTTLIDIIVDTIFRFNFYIPSDSLTMLTPFFLQ